MIQKLTRYIYFVLLFKGKRTAASVPFPKILKSWARVKHLGGLKGPRLEELRNTKGARSKIEKIIYHEIMSHNTYFLMTIKSTPFFGQ